MGKKPRLGGVYTLSDGTKGRIMSVTLIEPEWHLGHVSFKEWFDRHTQYEIIVAYELPNGNISRERHIVK